MRRLLPLLLVALLSFVLAACNGDIDDAVDDIVTDDDPTVADPAYDLDDQPADAQAEFVSPADGDTVASPVEVEMSALGVQIVPAGEPAVGEAHFHVIVDAGCVDDGEVLPGPSDAAQADGYFHFGDGSTSGELDLEPGTYELCLQLADGPHRAFGGTDVITITVE